MPTGNTGGATGGKAGTSSTLKKAKDVATSKGARPKEDADQGVMGLDPQQDDSMSREMLPCLPCTTEYTTAYCLE